MKRCSLGGSITVTFQNGKVARVEAYAGRLADRYGTRLCDDTECPDTQAFGGLHEHIGMGEP